MIFVTIVVYNAKLNHVFKSDDLSSFKYVCFDNSNQEEICAFNKSFCEENNIIYCGFKKNLGLSYAYNYVGKNILQENDYMCILDMDSQIDEKYFKLVNDSIQDDVLVYTPININKNNNLIDSPLLIKKSYLLKAKSISDEKNFNEVDYYLSINNGTIISKKALEKINWFDERIFLYFTDSYLYSMLYLNGIKTKVIRYHNYCDFSFDSLTYEKLIKRYKMMKADGYNYYKIIYKKAHRPLKAYIHYTLFNIKKSLECAKNTKKIYFFRFLFCRRER